MTKVIAAALALVLLLGALFFANIAPSPLPSPPPFEGDLPAASPPPGMAVIQVPTGVTHRSAAFGYRGGSPFEKREFAMTAVLVRHPRGDLLIDTGFGRNIDTQVKLLPWFFHATTSYTVDRPAADKLRAAGYDTGKLRAILLTHAHWDHVSGVPDFAGTPVLVTAEEQRFIGDGGFVTAIAREFTDVRYEQYTFEGGPYLGFPKSHDLYGDGSIVVVPAPGHTPGSVIVFLATPDGKRYAMLGDLVWQREGLSLREEKPWLQSRLADNDRPRLRQTLLHMAAVAARFPQIVIVPAHDQRGFAGMARLED